MAESWRETIARFFTLEGGESAIHGFDEERRLVVIREETPLDMARRIEGFVRDLNVGYEVKQL